jgi:hypothetical protein
LLLSIWVVATVVFVASLLTTISPRSWLVRLVLLTPLVWIILAWIADPAGQDAASDALYLFTLILTLVTPPFIAWILVSAINPDFLELPRPKRIAFFAALVVFALAGLGMGARNDVFLDCDDFRISGNDLPANCTSGPNTPNPNE